MKLSALALAAALLAACSSTPAATAAAATAAPATPAPTVAPATTAPAPAAVVYKADLKTANQNPAITGPEASCAGSVTITITGTSVKFDGAITGCPAGTAINIGHIHEGAAGVNGAVKVPTPLKAGDLTLVNGGTTFSVSGTVDAALAALIAANPAGYYFNLHSTVNGGGVIRGQLVKA